MKHSKYCEYRVRKIVYLTAMTKHNSQISPPRDTRVDADKPVFGLGLRAINAFPFACCKQWPVLMQNTPYRCGGSVGISPNFPVLMSAAGL